MNLLISAAEPSGDRLGAELVAALRRRLGNREPVRVRGLVGPLLEAEGAERVPGAAWVPPAMGVTEVVGHLGALRRNRRALLDALDATEGGVDAVVCVDAPDFHLPLARAARARGARTVGFVSPQLWAWRPGRAPSVAAAYDQLLCLFPFEPALYAGTGLDAVHVGHPAVDRVGPGRREEGVVAIFPGSRPAELRRHLAPFLAAAAALSPREILVAEAPGTHLDPSGLPPGARVVSGGEAIARAERALTKSGTVTLELALAGVPMVVAHRVHPLTWLVGRLVVRGVRHLALPNVLCDEEVVAERVQRFDPAGLAALLRAAGPPPTARLRALLGEDGVADRAVDALLRGLSRED